MQHSMWGIPRILCETEQYAEYYGGTEWYVAYSVEQNDMKHSVWIRVICGILCQTDSCAAYCVKQSNI